MQLLARYADVLRHGTIAMHAHRLVALTGVETAACAGGAHTAAGIRRHRDRGSGRQVLPAGCHLGGHLMAEHAGEIDHRIAASPSVQVGAAEADELHTQERFARARLHVGDVRKGRSAGSLQTKRLHLSSSMFSLSQC